MLNPNIFSRMLVEITGVFAGMFYEKKTTKLIHSPTGVELAIYQK